MIGWIKFEKDTAKLLAISEHFGRKFEAGGEIPLHRDSENRTSRASMELDNLVFGLNKITKGVFYGRKM